MGHLKRAALALALLPLTFSLAQTQPSTRPTATLSASADRPTAIYSAGDTITFSVSASGDLPGPVSYRLLKFGATPVASGPLDLSSGPATITTPATQPATYLLEVTSGPKEKTDSSPKPLKSLAAAVVDPSQITPALPAPADFDAFWAAKLAELAAIPLNPVLTPVDKGADQPEYFKLTLDNIRGSKVYGQLARPRSADAAQKFPAVLIVQWAGVYPLEPDWVLSRARDGWLALNILAHDVPFDLSKDEFKKLNETTLKDYIFQGDTDRESSYFLRMYLSTHRAAEYLTTRPDWDGTILVVTGGSQGGQQSIVAAALHPKITHVLANVPAGADSRGREFGRMVGFPYYLATPATMPPSDPNYPTALARATTSQYFDIINFAPKVKVPTLIGIGLIDTTCPAPGTLSMANSLAGIKEPVLMPTADHSNNHQPYYTRTTAWLNAIKSHQPLPPP